ncbi:MAG TPA: hypothetical protein ENN30_01425 [Candidatus Woesearchaeota archaeon]|nr:hypothetical protein [Candidatus Woesearchaeota archaeon]
MEDEDKMALQRQSEVSKSKWQQNYEHEALNLIRENRKKYSEMFKRNEHSKAAICMIGSHRTEEKLYICRKCGKVFCRYHGEVEARQCDICKGKGMF